MPVRGWKSSSSFGPAGLTDKESQFRQPAGDRAVPPVSPETSVCAIIVSYNPPAALYRNVLSLAGQVRSVLIIDNNSSPEFRGVLYRVQDLPYTEVVWSEANAGVGAALNRGVRRALELGLPWVLTLDQDSHAGEGFVASLLQAYTEHPDRETIGLVAPRYREETSGFFHDELPEDAAENAIIESSMMSGNLVRTEVAAQVGFYDEELFIDYVDHEFCLRLGRHGFRVLESRGSILEHNLGRMSRKTLAGVTLATTNHGPLRRYYNARNRILVYRTYGRWVPGWMARDIRGFAVDMVKILLLEQDRGAKFLSIARGIWHGITGKRGRAREQAR